MAAGKNVDLGEETAPAVVTPFQYHATTPSQDGSMRQFDLGSAAGVVGGVYPGPHSPPQSPPQSPPPGSRYSSEHSGAHLNRQASEASSAGYYNNNQSTLQPGVGAGIAGWAGMVPLGQDPRNGSASPPPPTVSGSTYSSNSAYGGIGGARSAKEREAMGYTDGGQQQQQLGLATTLEGDEVGGSRQSMGGGQQPMMGGQQPQMNMAPPERVTSPVLQHQDGGRVEPVVHEEAPSEIPPSYDSIPR